MFMGDLPFSIINGTKIGCDLIERSTWPWVHEPVIHMARRITPSELGP